MLPRSFYSTENAQRPFGGKATKEALVSEFQRELGNEHASRRGLDLAVSIQCPRKVVRVTFPKSGTKIASWIRIVELSFKTYRTNFCTGCRMILLG